MGPVWALWDSFGLIVQWVTMSQRISAKLIDRTRHSVWLVFSA
ncbi:hypothetical protein RBSH_04789 [Rhodopirellula baltica SH28]|uniref:Uncharacterized protein n=1 Tax=Rhodopirellula baltica SH28 TaxID=993517 RepID=K5E1R2_RHOBT|nr:hypothetical protein RBSH_04789 [Rhodopirellula baltica SH28]